MGADAYALRIQTGLELKLDGWYVIVDVNHQRWMEAGPCESEAEAEVKSREVARLVRAHFNAPAKESL